MPLAGGVSPQTVRSVRKSARCGEGKPLFCACTGRHSAGADGFPGFGIWLSKLPLHDGLHGAQGAAAAASRPPQARCTRAAHKKTGTSPAKEGTKHQVRNYVIKRLLLSVVILFCVTFIIYVMMRCLPSSFAETMAIQLSQAPGAKPYEEWLAQLNEAYGLDKGVVPGYLTWLSSAVRGDFGDSWKWNVSAVQKFQEVIGLSVVMGGISFVISLLISVPLGILAATKQYSRTDYVITAAALVGISLPTFFFATLLKLIFSVKLGWFDLYGLVGRNYAQLDAMGQFWDKANHLVLPIFTLIIISIGSTMRYTRTNMLEVLNADYIRTARAKGLSEGVVIYRHAFRNTLIPLVTIIGGSLPGLFTGALITETLFSIPGIGYISYQSMVAGDIPFTMFYLTFIAILTLLSNLLTDIMYAVVDPRVRIS